MGAGTYTGIEAVSNGLPILREPRTVTGKRTMLYMALSLAFIAGGILVAYLLTGVEPQTGKTLNAVLFARLTDSWRIGGFHLGTPIVTFTLLTEGALLFVAAQTGFVGGPQVLATMAIDRWVPRRFSNLSERLVTQDGVLAMGLAAVLVLIGTHARVGVLVMLYAINVFVTFTLSQLGMSVHWWSERRTRAFVDSQARRQWRRLCVHRSNPHPDQCLLKFHEGGWVTVAITSAVIALCYFVPSALSSRHQSDRATRGRRLAGDVRGFCQATGEAGTGRADRGAVGQRFQRPRSRYLVEDLAALQRAVPQRRIHQCRRSGCRIIEGSRGSPSARTRNHG